MSDEAPIRHSTLVVQTEEASEMPLFPLGYTVGSLPFISTRYVLFLSILCSRHLLSAERTPVEDASILLASAKTRDVQK